MGLLGLSFPSSQEDQTPLLADQLLSHRLGTPFRAGSFSASWAIWPLTDGRFVLFQTLDILLQF